MSTPKRLQRARKTEEKRKAKQLKQAAMKNGDSWKEDSPKNKFTKLQDRLSKSDFFENVDEENLTLNFDGGILRVPYEFVRGKLFFYFYGNECSIGNADDLNRIGDSTINSIDGSDLMRNILNRRPNRAALDMMYEMNEERSIDEGNIKGFVFEDYVTLWMRSFTDGATIPNSLFIDSSHSGRDLTLRFLEQAGRDEYILTGGSFSVDLTYKYLEHNGFVEVKSGNWDNLSKFRSKYPSILRTQKCIFGDRMAPFLLFGMFENGSEYEPHNERILIDMTDEIRYYNRCYFRL